MGIFGKKIEQPFKKQFAKEIILEKEYAFMYENFIISSQRELLVLLEEGNGSINILKFPFKIYKYGYPNDEVGLPSGISDVVYYGLSEVFNSMWIEELRKNNSSHSRHSDSFYTNYKHYIIRFKDVTLEVISERFEFVSMSKSELNEFIDTQISYLDNVR